MRNMRKKILRLTRRRSEEARRYRHEHGDAGVRFSGSKEPCLAGLDIMSTVTTFVTKDLLLLEIQEIDE